MDFMTHYERLKRKRLGDVLVDEGVVERDVVIRALQEQQLSRRLLSDILLEEDSVAQYDLARVIVDQYQVPFLDVSTYSLHKDLIEEYPNELLHEAGVLPLDRFGQQVCFACQEIPSQAHADQLRQHTDGGMYFYVALATDIRQCLQDHAPIEAPEKMEEVQAPDGAQVFGEEQVLSETLDGDSTAAEDAAWKNLFDSADDAIKAELGQEEEPGA